MFLSIRKPAPAASNLWGLCPRARRVQGRSLPRLRFAPACAAPRRFTGPAAAFERAAFPRGPRCPTKPREVHGFKPRRKEHHMSKSSNRPSHRVYAVSKNGERNFWQPIGAAWAHGDGDGFNLKFEYFPLNGAEIVIRKPKAVEADTAKAA